VGGEAALRVQKPLGIRSNNAFPLDLTFHFSKSMPREPSWKAIRLLQEPFNDALNYRSRGEKDLFNKLFLQTAELKECLAPSTYFLMGEKGAGKTAYAVFLENNVVDGHRCQVTTMTETQYKRFIELKRQGKLNYSDYANIWRSMLLFLTGRMLVLKSKGFFQKITGKFKTVERELERWTKNALNPEIESAFEAITSLSFASALGKKDQAQLSGERKAQEKENTPQLRHYLLETENAIKESLSTLTLSDSHVLFVDGIDYRPESVPYHEYIECVKGLAEAIWQLNTEFFNTIRDSRGRMKIVLLVRPDVFHTLNLYNSNSRLQDNTVFLEWSTNENEYRNSNLFEVGGRYFSMQNGNQTTPAVAWDHYYCDSQYDGATFKRLLRLTFQKPRDILTFIRLTRDVRIKSGHGDDNQFPADVLSQPAFTRKFSEYLLGETKNYAAFYMTQLDFQKYLKFFQYLDGKSRFSFDEFGGAYAEFLKWAEGEDFKAKEFLRDAEALLQFFYDVNIIGYTESLADDRETYYHWSYRERSLVDIAPKVKSTATLVINPGVAKALDIGKSFKRVSSSSISTPSRKKPQVVPGKRRASGRKRK
jgi:hypothetical protein